MAYTFDENIFSDLYKEVNGFRPRGHEFYSASDERKQEIWDQLLVEHEEELLNSAREDLDAQRRFEKLVNETIEMGAGDRATALRWIADAEGFDAYDAAYGGEAWCYHFRLWFGLKDQFEEVCQEIAARDGNPYFEEV